MVSFGSFVFFSFSPNNFLMNPFFFFFLTTTTGMLIPFDVVSSVT